MSVIADDGIIDQSEYEEFAGVTDLNLNEEVDDGVESGNVSETSEISPNWQLATEHTFVQEHFCKVTSCEYCGSIIASMRWHQGLRCKECSFDCHYNCAPMAPKNCLSLHHDAPLRPDILQPHSFYEKHFSSVTFCNICRKMLYGLGKQGFACSTCQFVAHEDCLPKAPINCPPQKLDAPLSDELRHYWIEGNLSGHCSLCRSSLSKLTILYGFRCAYCVTKVCPECFPRVQHNSCDEGEMASLKLGPGNLITHATDIIKKWTFIIPEDRRPLMVFINKKSGGQVGKIIAQRLSRVLNPNQIVDLSAGGPMPMLKKMQKVKRAYRVLACGGDGTAAWLLSALDKLSERGATYLPPIAVLPLGTGNDLARVLGWGGGYDSEALAPICRHIMDGHEVLLDRWKIEIDNVLEDHHDEDDDEHTETTGMLELEVGDHHDDGGHFSDNNTHPDHPEEVKPKKKRGRKAKKTAPDTEVHGPPEVQHHHPDAKPTQVKIMNNYFSIGIDAKIALEFHRKREAHPSQFKSRGMNKVIYAGIGAGKMFENLPNLSKCLRVSLDGRPLALPKTLEGIMVLNLASYAGGTNPWGSPSRSDGFAPQSPCDGVFEVLGITSSFHLGQMSASLSDGMRLGQGREISFSWINDETLPVQLDGEPWEEPKSTIRLSFFTKSRMIASPSEKSHWTKQQWLEPLSFTPPIRPPHEVIDTEPHAADIVEHEDHADGKKKKKKKTPRHAEAASEDLLVLDANVASSSGVQEIVEQPKEEKKKKKKEKDLLIDLDESSAHQTHADVLHKQVEALGTTELAPLSLQTEDKSELEVLASNEPLIPITPMEPVLAPTIKEEPSPELLVSEE